MIRERVCISSVDTKRYPTGLYSTREDYTNELCGVHGARKREKKE